MKNFDSRVQQMKYKVLKELAVQTWKNNDAFTAFNEISNNIVVKGEPPISCCIYKDRAIIADRMRVGLGDCIGEKSTVQVVSIACDECPKSGHVVTNLCRGCLAQNCVEKCPKDAVAIDERGYAHIDKKKCIECGACLRACSYKAIANQLRPCEMSCRVDAITADEDGAAKIVPEKCIVCGECVYECPFGALLDRSQIVDVVKILRDRKDKRVYAVIAPAIAAQFEDMTLGQVVAGLKMLGFDEVHEAAEGADTAAAAEADELLKKGLVTTSCCPSFVEYIRIYFPELEEYISETPSPMALKGMEIKKKDPDGKVVFIGPCISKKWEQTQGNVSEYIDNVLTFEELNALFHSIDLKHDELEEEELSGASQYGRGFCVSGGVTAAVREVISEMGSDFDFRPIVCNGIEECRAALMKVRVGRLDANFIEGMICDGGCIEGNGGLKNKKNAGHCIEEYCNSAEKKNVL